MSYNLRSTRKLSLCHIIQCVHCSYCIIYIRLKRISGCFQLLPHAIQINLFRRKRRKSLSSACHNIVLGSRRYSVRILYLRPIEAVCDDDREDFDLLRLILTFVLGAIAVIIIVYCCCMVKCPRPDVAVVLLVSLRNLLSFT